MPTLLGSLEYLVTGVDVDQVQADSDRADAALKALNDPHYALLVNQGVISAQTADLVTQHEATSAAGTADITGQVGTAFQQGLQDGLNNELSILKNPLSGLFKIVPWQWWVIGGGVAFFYFGGIKLLKK